MKFFQNKLVNLVVLGSLGVATIIFLITANTNTEFTEVKTLPAPASETSLKVEKEKSVVATDKVANEDISSLKVILRPSTAKVESPNLRIGSGDKVVYIYYIDPSIENSNSDAVEYEIAEVRFSQIQSNIDAIKQAMKLVLEAKSNLIQKDLLTIGKTNIDQKGQVTGIMDFSLE